MEAFYKEQKVDIGRNSRHDTKQNISLNAEKKDEMKGLL
jgi:hypothetical protein